MGSSQRSLKALGEHLAEQQDLAQEGRLDRERGRARLLEAEIRGRARRAGSPALRLVAPLAAALLLAALSVVILRRPPDPLRFELGAAAPGVVGEWIAAPPEAELPIRFSDGSVLLLAPGGRARVAGVEPDGAEVALERGALDLSVAHRPRTRWRVRVGPFQVHVIGTRFATHWDPVTEEFGVALREGAITVSGPVVGEGRAVHAGEQITVSAAAGTLEVGSIREAFPQEGAAPAQPFAAPPQQTLAPAAPQPVVGPPSAAASSSGGARVAPSAGAQAARPEPSAAAEAPARVEAPAALSWRALALEARYREALAAAEREGFDGLCGSASAGDLRALGDAARLGGSTARALQALAALRRRFPGSPEAASAAFILGRIAQDQSKDYAGAARWFTRYLSEQPGGSFAADALGRLVEAEDKQGDADGARRAAARYLASYPGGSHAGYARRVLAQAGAPAP